MAPAQARAAVASYGVDLVDEDDARRVPFALIEKIADTGGPDADEHLHEVGAREREERDGGLARDGLGKERLSRTRRAEQEGALGDPSAETLEFLGVAKKLDDFLELLLGLVRAGHVLEGDLGAVFHEHLGPALS